MSTDEYAEVRKDFQRVTVRHKMTVLQDTGLYRHLSFRDPMSSIYWFDLITVPGTLIFQGDMDSLVFSRTTDMFSFFRTSAWQGAINPQYWEEKLTCHGRSTGVRRYDPKAFVSAVKDDIAYPAEDLPGLKEAVQAEILDDPGSYQDEAEARQLVSDFTFYAGGASNSKLPDFEFTDFWEWNLNTYTYRYLWACNAILSGINQYDAAKTAVAA